jgi:UDP-N-acetylglucosamine 2-epimerase (non-hydrolysing)
MTPLRLAVILGTRPEAIKMAPVVIAARDRDDVVVDVVCTGQHREMLDPALGWFGIEPAVDLDIIGSQRSVGGVVGAAVAGIADWLEDRDIDWVLVQGDTGTTLAGALAGFYGMVPVAHVEAGLRSDDVRNPFPEEMNRRLATTLTTLHLPPTPRAATNLTNEGVCPSQIVVTGNTGIDALLLTASHSGALRPVDPDAPRLLVTMHRRENQGEPMHAVCVALLELLERHRTVTVRLPAHLSPAVREVVVPMLGAHPRIDVCEPLDYPAMVAAMQEATLILTDSGGIQEEAPTFGKPVLVLRDTTERPEAVEAGLAELIGCDPRRIVERTSRLLDDPEAYRAMSTVANPFGDGHAAHRVLDAVVDATVAGRERRPDAHA